MRSIGRVAAVGVCGIALGLLVGCGFIADKDRIKIAKLKDHYITRGELAKVIREMPDDERPIIRSKGDLLRVLNEYIDLQIKEPLARDLVQQMESQGKTLVPRSMAMQRYFQEHAEDDYASMYAVQSAEAAGMTQVQLDVMKQQIDVGIDRVLDKLQGDAAVAQIALDALKQGRIAATDAEYEREYKLRSGEFKRLEWLDFLAFRFPAEAPDAERRAAEVRQQLNTGADFEKLLDEYAMKDPAIRVRSEIENNPGLAKFQGFWLNAAGSQKGDVIGPVYLPEYQVMGERDATGRTAVKNLPAAYLILKVMEHRPESPLPLEEAKPQLAPFILIAKMMEKLRTDNGVEIYEKNLPDPALFTDEYGKSVAERQ